MLSRAAADQRFKIGGVKAVFVTRCTMNELSALPGLLYASQEAALTVVLPNSADKLERLVQIVHGNHQHPVVLLCPVPSEAEVWWKVYEDEHIFVHAVRYHDSSDADGAACDLDACAGSTDKQIEDRDESSIVVYLYTFRSLVRSAVPRNSIMILPAAASPRTILSIMQPRLTLPILSATEGVDVPVSLLTTLVIQHHDDRKAIPTISDNSCFYFLIRQQKNAIDLGLLVRAQNQTLAWRKRCSPALLKYFPYRTSTDLSSTTTATVANDGSKEPLRRHIWLNSGTSVVFDVSVVETNKNKGSCPSCQYEAKIIKVTSIDRNEQRERTAQLNSNSCDEDTIVNGQIDIGTAYDGAGTEQKSSTADKSTKDRDSWPEKLERFLTFKCERASTGEVMPSCADENEIDLEDGNESHDDMIEETLHTSEDHVKLLPHLLVLGSGCAAPSPYRGASGYALILPSPANATPPADSTHDDAQLSLVVAIDVGEGYCTQWNRFAGDRPFSSIQVIWISHAHWDHYGGLVTLLLQIYQEKQLQEQRHQFNSLHSDDVRPNKRYRTGCPLGQVTKGANRRCQPPWVVAPIQVLQFLNLVFDEPAKYFREVHSNDASTVTHAFSSVSINEFNPFSFWENVRVDHSCQAYGFVVGLRYGGSPFIFCFSGDTRPSLRLVQVCRDFSKMYGAGGRVDFLLHEATFDEGEKHMSLTKKHSTVQEALSVARDVDARRIMLTHFSQRYDSVPNIDEESNRFNCRMMVGFALDGVLVPFFTV